MAVPTPAQLLNLWEPDSRGTASARLAALLAAVEGPGIDADTLGQRNRRLLQLQQDLVGGSIAAHVACAACATDNEFEVPAGAILATPEPAAGAVVAVGDGRRHYRFRLPTMRDLAGLHGGVREAVLLRCQLTGPRAIPAAVAASIEARFEALDPAANIVVNIGCAGCCASIAATVDIGDLVACDLDRLADALLRDIDTIASTYGWDEAAVLALPATRRRRYIAMIAARRQTPRVVTGQRA